MKKLSISLFAVLAIVFAVSSAFTTGKKAQSFSDRYELWAVTTVVDQTPDATEVTNASKIRMANQTSLFDFDGAGGFTTIQYDDQIVYALGNQGPFNEPFPDYDAALSDKDVSCNSSTTRTCVAYTKDTNNDGSINQVLGFKLGQYSAVTE